MNKFICRPRDYVIAAGRLYPQAWKQADSIRNRRGLSLPDWSDWCYLPIAATQAILADDARVDGTRLHLTHPERITDAASLAGLAAWRMTQGIYRFDPSVYNAVRDTPVAGDIPHDMLYRLPEWCIYIETPDMLLGNGPMPGAFVHLEHDTNTGRPELRFLLDVNAKSGPVLIPAVLHLGPWTLAEALARSVGSSVGNASGIGMRLPSNLNARLRLVMEPLVSLLLYICSQANEIGDGNRRPKNPMPKNVKGGPRLFAADKPTTWDVGVRLGAALRCAYAAEETGQIIGHTGPRPHIRRAHWHGFRSGPMKCPDGTDIAATERRFELRWLPPTAVNVGDVEDLPAVVRTVS